MFLACNFQSSKESLPFVSTFEWNPGLQASELGIPLFLLSKSVSQGPWENWDMPFALPNSAFLCFHTHWNVSNFYFDGNINIASLTSSDPASSGVLGHSDVTLTLQLCFVNFKSLNECPLTLFSLSKFLYWLQKNFPNNPVSPWIPRVLLSKSKQYFSVHKYPHSVVKNTFIVPSVLGTGFAQKQGIPNFGSLKVHFGL